MSSLSEQIEAHEKELIKKLGTYKDLALILGISLNKSQELMRRKDAPVIRIGRNKYIVLSKIDAWLEDMMKV